MKRQYDFSKGERGKFFHKGAELRLPLYLNTSAQKRLMKIAETRGGDPGELVERLIAREFRGLQKAR